MNNMEMLLEYKQLIEKAIERRKMSQKNFKNLVEQLYITNRSITEIGDKSA